MNGFPDRAAADVMSLLAAFATNARAQGVNQDVLTVTMCYVGAVMARSEPTLAAALKRGVEHAVAGSAMSTETVEVMTRDAIRAIREAVFP